MLEEIASEGEMSSAKASEVQGLLNFVLGFFAGKSLVSAFMPLRSQVSYANTQK